MSIRKSVVYARLSRDEIREAGTTEEKLAAQVESCKRLAQSHNLPIHEILIERASGATLAGRPELLKLLLLCRRGEVSHILCTFPDRLSRLDGRDRWDFEEALQDGGVTVISTTGTTRYDHEEEPFGRRVLAEAAAYELRAFGRRLKERNAQNIQANKRTGGSPPYGYRRDKAAPGGYVLAPHEYPVLCQVLRGILDGRSLHSLVSSLNASQVPAPRGRRWHVESLTRIALNPFYAGRHSHRTKIEKRGSHKRLVQIPIDEYVIAPEAGEWEYPLSWEEYSHLRASFSSRYTPNPRVGLLTGILYCPEGGRMARMGEKRYQCFCSRVNADLPQRCAMREALETAAKDAVHEAFCSMRPDALGLLQSTANRSDLYMLHSKAQRATREAFSALEQIARSQPLLTQYADSGAYEEMVRRAGIAHSAAKLEEARLSSLLAQPEYGRVVGIVERVREVGFERLWSALTEDERREMLRLVLRRIELPQRGREKGRRWPPPVIAYQEWVVGAGG